MIGFIYKLTFINGNCYIGQTIDIDRRIKEYNKKNPCKSQPLLRRNILKYKFFCLEILYKGECNFYLLNELEKHYIGLYNTFNSDKGLNLTNGGLNHLKSEETKKKIGVKHKGKTIPIQQRIFLSESKKGKKIKHLNNGKRSDSHCKNISLGKLGCTPWNKGIKRTEEEKNKMSLNRKGKMTSEKNHMSRIILDTYNGIYYFGISEASESINVSYHSLRDSLSGKKKNKTNLIYV